MDESLNTVDVALQRERQQKLSLDAVSHVSRTNIQEYLHATKGHRDKCIGCSECLKQ